MSFRRVAPIVALAALLLTAPASASTRTVSIVDFAFARPVITAGLGDDVQWTNDGIQEHTTTRTGFPAWSVHLAAGAHTSITFVAAGTFAYICAIHPSMHGVVKVPVRVSPTGGGTTTTFTIRVAAADAKPGTVYVVQRMAPGGRYLAWRTTSHQTLTFKSTVKGTWRFRAQVRKVSSGKASSFSPSASATIH